MKILTVFAALFLSACELECSKYTWTPAHCEEACAPLVVGEFKPGMNQCFRLNDVCECATATSVYVDTAEGK